MGTKPQDVLSAQVLLRGPGGRRLHEHARVTADTLAAHAPTQEEAAAAARAFRDRGFEVGPMVGVSFSITGPAGLFEEVFGHRLRQEDDSRIVLAEGPAAGGQEYEDRDVPPELRPMVDKVVFSPPPDFGPVDFHA